MSNSTTYAAFLLGINIGPHKRVPMGELKKMCERMGFSNVRTLLASGNVVFGAPKKNADTLARDLEAQLKETFGFEVGVIVCTMADIQKMIDANPFKKIKETKNAIRYVTFYTAQPKEKIPTGEIRDKKGSPFRILSVSDSAVFSVRELGVFDTPDIMSVLGKMLGKKITTRNWNTIEKLIR
jgi:uncharacterized protein (DUF1697 family)